MAPRPVKPFEDECQSSLGALRASLIELCDDLGTDPEAPQEIARRLGVNKTLTWSVSRMMRASSYVEALPHVPGTAAMEQFLKAAEKHGANRYRVSTVRAAAIELQDLVAKHFDDRGTLDLVLDGVDNPLNSGLEGSRKLAFRGNSGIFGVQAKTRTMTGFLAPNRDDPTQLDMVIVAGYVGFRRLRGNVKWPLFRIRSWGDSKDAPITSLTQGWQPVDPKSHGKQALMPEFCSQSMQSLSEELSADGLNLILEPGPVGNHGAVNCFRGEFCRAAAPRYAERENDIGELGVSITTPSEDMIIDVLYHKDLDFVGQAECLVYGQLFSHGMKTDSPQTADTLLPIRPVPSRLLGRPPVVSSPLVPRYSEMVKFVSERLGWEQSDFQGLRIHMDFPPLGSSVLVRFPLPTAPTL